MEHSWISIALYTVASILVFLVWVTWEGVSTTVGILLWLALVTATLGWLVSRP